MNLIVFFMTHKALRKQNKILRDRNRRQRDLLRSKVFDYGAGFKDAMAICRAEEKLLHEEIAHLNDLLVAK